MQTHYTTCLYRVHEAYLAQISTEFHDFGFYMFVLTISVDTCTAHIYLSTVATCNGPSRCLRRVLYGRLNRGKVPKQTDGGAALYPVRGFPSPLAREYQMSIQTDQKKSHTERPRNKPRRGWGSSEGAGTVGPS